MMNGMNLMVMAWLMLAGVILDLLLGEARRWHPLVGFGHWANAVERRGNRGRARFWRGLAAWALAVLPLTALAWWLLVQLAAVQFWYAAALHAVLLYLCIGLRSLREHALPIAQALAAGDLPAARRLTSRIVSRDTSAAEETDLAKAGVESLLENGNDAVFGTLFWFLVAGGPGAVLFRLSNTLDAMWGYRTPRYAQFGCAAARIDDALNWLPARLTALSYAVLGDWRQAWSCWRRQAPQWSSPNAGPVMAAGAGALNLALGGAATYHGELEQRPLLGAGMPPQAADIVRAWQLVLRTTILWLAATLVIAWVVA